MLNDPYLHIDSYLWAYGMYEYCLWGEREGSVGDREQLTIVKGNSGIYT